MEHTRTYVRIRTVQTKEIRRAIANFVNRLQTTLNVAVIFAVARVLREPSLGAKFALSFTVAISTEAAVALIFGQTVQRFVCDHHRRPHADARDLAVLRIKHVIGRHIRKIVRIMYYYLLGGNEKKKLEAGNNPSPTL